MSEINVNTLKPIYTQYYLGKHNVDDNVTGSVPVFIEGKDGKWWVRAQLGGLNPWYLNRTTHDQYFTMKDRTEKYGYTTYWRYKCYSSFTTLEEAVNHFNRVVYGDLKQKPSEIPVS